MLSGAGKPGSRPHHWAWTTLATTTSPASGVPPSSVWAELFLSIENTPLQPLNGAVRRDELALGRVHALHPAGQGNQSGEEQGTEEIGPRQSGGSHGGTEAGGLRSSIRDAPGALQQPVEVSNDDPGPPAGDDSAPGRHCRGPGGWRVGADRRGDGGGSDADSPWTAASPPCI